MLSLDDLIDASAPPTSVPPAVADHGVRILRESSRRQSRRAVWITGAALGFTLLSGGAAVAAATGLLDQLPWTPDIVASPGDAGQPCEAAWHIDAPPGVTADAPYIVEAHRILGELDPDTLDISNEYDEVRRHYEIDGVYDSAGGRVIRTDGEYRAEALSVAVQDELDRQLRTAGFGDELEDTGYLLQGATACELGSR